METIIQKCVELGVHEIVPVQMKRCVVKLDCKKEEAKRKRWQAISESAAKQAGRGLIPDIHPLMTYKEALLYASDKEHILVPFEHAENMQATRDALSAVKPGEQVAIFIGPEGGFEDEEIAQAENCGAQAIDNSATTRVDAQVQELMKKLMDVDFGNPSSRHQKGVVAEGYIKEARQKIAATLKVDPKELIITSGGTESNNMALIGTALAAKRKGNHIITTAVEHPSVKATASFLEEQGFRITFLSVDSRGQISLEDLKEALTPDTILVSIMYVNNEIGTIQPVEEAAKLVHATVPGAVFHVDAIQAYGKVMIRPKQQGIDLLSVSSHKFHGPKGAGFLYCSSKVNLHPIIFGGGQQSGMRSGTENVPGAAGMGLAAEIAYKQFEQKKAHLNELRRYFLEGVHQLEGITVKWLG